MKDTRMAKVFELRIRIDGEYLYQMVTTVSDNVTIDMVCGIFGIRRDAIIDYKETSAMPLGFALEYSRRRKAAMGLPPAKAVSSNVFYSIIRESLASMDFAATR